MADRLINVKGLEELKQFLEVLPVKMERNFMRSSLSAGAAVVRNAARSKVRNRSGALAKSLRVSSRILRTGVITASVKSRLPYARLVEYGTKPHEIRAKDGGMLEFGGHFSRWVNHPGARPHPYLRPALDSQAENAVAAVAAKLKSRLTKEHLNTPDVFVDGKA